MLDPSVRHVPEANRYEYVADDEPLAVVEYRVDGDVVVMFHTSTEPSQRGRGLAARVVQRALDDVRARGLRVEPRCWFVAEFIASHPEYRDLVTAP